MFFLLLVTASAFAQTITQKGVAYQYNGKEARTPLGNVTISYDGNQRTTISGEQDGTFSLTLTGRKMGDRIGGVTVRKREMMVFNQQAVDEWSVRKEPLRLILCNADEFERQKENLIAIGKREAKKKYDRQVAELEKLLAEGKIKLQEKDSALDKAYEELERARKHMDEYADLFARIDESEVDTLAQQAIELFNRGEVELAIQKFEEGRYMEKLDNAIKNSRQADKLKAVAEQAKERATQDSLKAVQSLKAQIEAYKLNNEWGKAGALLKGIADKSGDVEEIFAYAKFCQKQNIFAEAEAYYNRALIIYRRPEQENPQAYEPYVAQIQYNIGFLKVKQQHYPDAIVPFEEALEIYRRIMKVNPAQRQWYENCLFYLCELYPATNNYIAAYKINQEWLPILKNKYEADSESVRSDYAVKLGDQSFNAIFMKNYPEAEQLAREGLSIDSTKIFIYTNLAAALLFQGKYTEAEQIYRQYKSELKESFLDDFNKFAEAGVIPKKYEADLEKIKKMLNEE